MKKLMLAAAAMAVGVAMAVESNVVGYQNKAPASNGYNYLSGTFARVDGGIVKWGDIGVNDGFVFSTIQLVDENGRTEKISFEDVNGGEEVYFILEWWTTDDGAPTTGWYLSSDTSEFNHCMNDEEIPLGSGFCLDYSVDDTEPALVFSGAVSDQPVTPDLHNGYNYIGNCSPKNITYGDLIVNEGFVFSTIQLVDENGRTQKIKFDDVNGGEEVYFILEWWTTDDGAPTTGWYLSSDTSEFNHCMNEYPLLAADGFCVDGSVDDTDPAISIPAALPKAGN